MPNPKELRKVVSSYAKNSGEELPTVDVLSFISNLASDAAKHPGRDVDRILAEYGYTQGSASESDFSLSDGGSMSFAMDSFSSSSVSFKGIVSREERKNSLAPFVCDLAFRSLPQHGEDDDTIVDGMCKWAGIATILFIDLSGYSRISAQLISQGGAHALSEAVNSYFESILSIVVDKHGGDVLKFAGDAIVVAFQGDPDERRSCLTAVACAMELQKRCGMHPVTGTDLFFRLHIGIASGCMESEVFEAPNAKAMQKAYHFASGAPFTELGPIVDAAGKGEVCVSAHVAKTCGDEYIDSVGEGLPHGIRLVKSIEDNYFDAFDAVPDEPVKRDAGLENKLVHQSITRKLRQGFQPSHIAEMRVLCVLFIHKSIDTISTADWFGEVQAILDEGRAPIVQIIDDDKGTHVVAAVSLYIAEFDPANVGLKVARRLRDREAGCTVGVASGEVFCGVTGSTSACRWDITGPACVRACRLMQHASTIGATEAIDSSVYHSTTDVSQMVPKGSVSLKGSDEPVAFYALSDESITTTSGIYSTSWMSQRVHGDSRAKLMSELIQNEEKQRGCAVITGPIGVGKKSLAMSVLDMTAFINIVHSMARRAKPLSIAETLSQWFMYHSNAELQELGKKAHTAFMNGHSTQMLSLCLQLVSKTIELGLHTALIVVQGQFLDSVSASFFHQLLLVDKNPEHKGRFLVFVTVTPMYGIQNVAGAIHKNVAKVQLTKTTLSPLSTDDMADVLFTQVYWKPTELYASTFTDKSGGSPLFAKELVLKLREEFLSRMKQRMEGKNVHLLSTMPVLGVMELTPAGVEVIKGWKWSWISPQTTARLGELYDVLPPRLQLQLRVLGAISCDGNGGGAMLRTITVVTQRLVSKITKEQCENDFKRLAVLSMVKVNGEFVEFTSPMLHQVVRDLLTPDQDKLLKRIAARNATDIIDNDWSQVDRDTDGAKCGDCNIADGFLYVAQLWRGAKDDEKAHHNIKRAHEAIMRLPADSKLYDELYLKLGLFLNRYYPGESEKILGTEIVLKKYCDAEVATQNPKDVMEIQWTKDLIPPFPTGGYGGEVQKLAYQLCNEGLALARPGVRYLVEGGEVMLKVDVPALMDAIARFEKTVPCPEEEKQYLIDPKEEQALFEMIQAGGCKTVAEVNEKASKLHQYYDTTFMSRTRRVVAYCKGLQVCIRPAKKTQFKAEMSGAFARLCKHDENGEIPSIHFHEALMDLATAKWTTPYMMINLQMIRDSCLKMQTATFLDFKAMLFSFLLMGTHISGDVMVSLTTLLDDHDTKA